MYDASNILKEMEEIEYGFKNEDGINLVNTNSWDDFSSFYYLLSPKELIESKCGVCWDQVELERKLFLEKGMQPNTYFIYIDNKKELPSHTFLVFEDNNKYYWFEHSWGDFKGIHEYESIFDLLNDVKNKFVISRKNEVNIHDEVYIYKYKTPKEHITCEEFYDYIKSQERIVI